MAKLSLTAAELASKTFSKGNQYIAQLLDFLYHRDASVCKVIK